jgi:hypothetical protein
VWSSDEAAQYLYARLRNARDMAQATVAQLEALATVLGCVPLAVEQSAVYLIRTRTLYVEDLPRYIARLRADIGVIESNAQAAYLEGGYRGTLLATFRGCVTLVRTMAGGERALDLLRAVCCEDIRHSVQLQSLFSDFDDAVLCLRRVSLVRSTKEQVLVNALVQQLTRQELSGPIVN